MDLIISPQTVAFNTQAGTAAPPLQLGEVVDALVVKLLEDGSVRLSVGDALLDVQTQVPLQPGTTVRLAVKNTNDGIQLVLVGKNAGSASEGSEIGAGRALPTPGGATSSASTGAGVSNTAASESSAASQNEPPETVAQAAPVVTGGSQPQSPALALAQAVRSAAVQQNGLAPLFADVAEATTSLEAALPQAVQDAAAQLLALRPQLDADLDAEDIKQAFTQSGLFFEARLAAATAGEQTSSPGATSGSTSATSETAGTARATTSSPNDPQTNAAEATAPAASDDLKAALAVFRQVLQTWLATEPSEAETSATAATLGNAKLGPQTPVLQSAPPIAQDASAAETVVTRAPTTQSPAPPPPYRGAPTSAQPVAESSIAANASARDIGARLLSETDGALSRQTLLQAASLPESAQAQSMQMNRGDASGPRWNFEIPFATQNGTAVAQFEISRDGRSGQQADGTKTIWRARFTLDVEPMGAVHAQVSLIGSRTAVTLWAERSDSAAKLRANSALLSDALKQAELEPGDVLVRDGSPPRPQQALPAGRFLDRAS